MVIKFRLRLNEKVQEKFRNDLLKKVDTLVGKVET